MTTSLFSDTFASLAGNSVSATISAVVSNQCPVPEPGIYLSLVALVLVAAVALYIKRKHG